MRLIKVDTYELCEIPKPDEDHNYAILSHTWGKEEVTYQELSAGVYKTKLGFNKIAQFCEQARLEGLEYAWIDTCCIDKTSSSELSEAINSMYEWYRQSTVCYVYLWDVLWDARNSQLMSFRGSRWFKRGWTLQELIAPRHVVFYDRDWNELGTKFSLRKKISHITRIPEKVLIDIAGTPLTNFCIAQRMSWAANRKTTREEDMAYCLMGIFDVNMPVLYGEGKKAFIRLQQEIMKGSDDHSLFAWGEKDMAFAKTTNDVRRVIGVSPEDKYGLLGSMPPLFAPNPDSFKLGQGIRRIGASSSQNSPYTITNRGLHIFLPLIKTNILLPSTDGVDPLLFLAALNCCRADDLDAQNPLCLFLCRYPSGNYRRLSTSLGNYTLWHSGQTPSPCELYIDLEPQPEPSSTLSLWDNPLRMKAVLLLINCSAVKCSVAFKDSGHKVRQRSSFRGSAFALTVGPPDWRNSDQVAVVLLFKAATTMSCAIYQPCDLPPSNHVTRDLLNQFARSNSVGADRAMYMFPTGDVISVQIRPRSPGDFYVIIARRGNEELQEPIPLDSGLREYARTQQRYTHEWGHGIVHSREVWALPSDMKIDEGVIKSDADVDDDEESTISDQDSDFGSDSSDA